MFALGRLCLSAGDIKRSDILAIKEIRGDWEGKYIISKCTGYSEDNQFHQVFTKEVMLVFSIEKLVGVCQEVKKREGHFMQRKVWEQICGSMWSNMSYLGNCK